MIVIVVGIFIISSNSSCRVIINIVILIVIVIDIAIDIAIDIDISIVLNAQRR